MASSNSEGEKGHSSQNVGVPGLGLRTTDTATTTTLEASGPRAEISPGITIVPSPYLSSPQEFEERDEGVRRNPDEPVRGWPLVAKTMADAPGFASFPAFRTLNLKSLLYYQVEISVLQEQLHKEELKDARDSGNQDMRRFYGQTAEKIFESDNEQRRLVGAIRDLLRAYNGALIQFQQVSSMPKPEPFNIDEFRRWMKEERGGAISIHGAGSASWGSFWGNNSPPHRTIFQVFRRLVWSDTPIPDELDLITPHEYHKPDALTRWIIQEVIPYLNYRKASKKRALCMSRTVRDTEQQRPQSNPSDGNAQPVPLWRHIVNWLNRSGTQPEEAKDRGEEKPHKMEDRAEEKKRAEKSVPITLETYSGNKVLRFSASVATTIACLLPTVAITVLNEIQDIKFRFLAIAAFTTVFAIGIMAVTSAAATRIEIFTATAAFVAVMVVFVQNNGPQMG